MNGRVYDPKLARFIQADPIVQDRSTTRSLNRYSYVWNNPLNATDPSGYTAESADGSSRSPRRNFHETRPADVSAAMMSPRMELSIDGASINSLSDMPAMAQTAHAQFQQSFGGQMEIYNDLVDNYNTLIGRSYGEHIGDEDTRVVGIPPARRLNGNSRSSSSNRQADRVNARNHFSWWERTWSYAEFSDYGIGYSDLNEALNVATQTVLETRACFDKNSTGYGNAASQVGRPIGVYVYHRSGYYWVGRSVNSTVAAGGCGSCLAFSGSNVRTMPRNVHTLVAVTSGPKRIPEDSYWSNIGSVLPGGAIVYRPADPPVRYRYP